MHGEMKTFMAVPKMFHNFTFFRLVPGWRLFTPARQMSSSNGKTFLLDS